MGRAFDSIQRNPLIKDLKSILNQDELHLIQIVLHVKIAAKFANCKSWFFSTGTRAPQGDCTSVSEFSFYPAKLIENTIANETLSLVEHKIIQNNFSIVPQNYQIEID